MNEWVKWMNHHPTKRVINPQNQLIYAKNAFCVQLSLVLREHVNQNCTARLKKIGTDSSLWYNIQWGKKVRLQTWKPFYFLFQSPDDKVSTCLHIDRFAVLLTVSCSFNITLIQFGKRFFKTRIWSMQYKFLCETFRLSLGSKKSKKYACDKRKRSIQNMELFLLYSPATKCGHIYQTIDL